MRAKDLEIEPCGLCEIKDFVEKNHYSHSVNGVKITFCFSVKFNGELVGGVIFGAMSTTAWKRFAAEEQRVLELRRLVLDNEAGKNSESRVIGYCLRWIKKHAKHIDIVVSYADPLHGHTGVVYRASNFKYEGISNPDKGFIDKESGKVYHSRALRTKYRGDYKPFVKRLREKLERNELEVITLPGKHCYTYLLNSKEKETNVSNTSK